MLQSMSDWSRPVWESIDLGSGVGGVSGWEATGFLY